MRTQEITTAASASAFAVMAAASMNSAFAADLPARTAGYAPLPVLAGWQGFYVGGSVGGSWLNSHTDDSLANPWGWSYGTPIGNDSHASKFGALGGFQAGYNMQSRSLVFGVEADFSFLNAKSTANSVMATTGYSGYSVATTKENKISHLGTLRARVGVDMNGTMPYLTAGVAFGRVTNRYTTTDLNGYGGDTDSSSRKWQTGFVVGGGVEHKITENVSIKGEVLFVGFGDKSRSVPSNYASGNGGTVKASNDLTIGRVGLNYRF
jgi:outer membrane immunogenic protein